MPDHDFHPDLGAYLLRGLEADEDDRFERHLEECPACRAQATELSGVASLLERAAPSHDLPHSLRERTLGAVREDVAAAQRGERSGPATRHDLAAPASANGAGRAGGAVRLPDAPKRPWLRRPWVQRPAFALGAACALAAAVFAGTRLDTGRDAVAPVVDGPVVAPELEARLIAPRNPDALASATVTKAGIGRIIEFRTDDLPILPKGEFYELWFVGPGDTLEEPNRISAGTFHPDPEGRSKVTFAAAVDPKLYPEVSVTAEPGDGDPRRTGAEVLRSAKARNR